MRPRTKRRGSSHGASPSWTPTKPPGGTTQRRAPSCWHVGHMQLGTRQQQLLLLRSALQLQSCGRKLPAGRAAAAAAAFTAHQAQPRRLAMLPLKWHPPAALLVEEPLRVVLVLVAVPPKMPAAAMAPTLQGWAAAVLGWALPHTQAKRSSVLGLELHFAWHVALAAIPLLSLLLLLLIRSQKQRVYECTIDPIDASKRLSQLCCICCCKARLLRCGSEVLTLVSMHWSYGHSSWR